MATDHGDDDHDHEHECGQCGGTFDTEDELLTHAKEEHDMDV